MYLSWVRIVKLLVLGIVPTYYFVFSVFSGKNSETNCHYATQAGTVKRPWLSPLGTIDSTSVVYPL